MKGTKVSDTAKLLIFIVIGLGIVALSYFVIYKPNMDKKSKTEAEIVQLQERYDYLQSLNLNREQYQLGITKFGEDFDAIIARFPNNLLQEKAVMFIEGLENSVKHNWVVNSIEMPQRTVFYTIGSGAAVSDGQLATDAAATDEASTEAVAEVPVASTGVSFVDLGSDFTEEEFIAALPSVKAVGLKVLYSINYRGTYDGIKAVLAYIQNFPERSNIEALNIAVDEDGIYAGTMNIAMYAVATAENFDTEYDVPGNFEIGVDNIFTANGEAVKTGKYASDNGAAILKDYDHFVMLSPSSSDVAATIIGKNESNGGESTYLKSNENSVQQVTIKYFMKDGKYYISYKIGDESFPTNFDNGTEFVPGDDMNLLVTSKARKDSQDVSGVKVSIINETDKVLNIKVQDDDTTSPRWKITNKSGDVVVY